MIDLFPSLRATLLANDYFVTDLEGFEDSSGFFKVFKGDESPTAETPFITIEINPGGQSPNTNWYTPFATFHIMGQDTDWETLYAIAHEIRDIFEGTTIFEAVGSDAAVEYITMGEAEFSEGRNPATEHVVVSVALRFGIAE